MTAPVYIVDLFENIVKSMDLQVNYLYGHPIEVNETLVNLSKISTNPERFPLIHLITDFDEIKGKRFGVDADVSLHVLISGLTKKEYSANERMERVFKPLLIPIYLEFLNKIARSKYFTESTKELIEHTKTNRLMWGKAGVQGYEGLIFTDVLDCIEITDLKLTVKNNICNGNN